MFQAFDILDKKVDPHTEAGANHHPWESFHKYVPDKFAHCPVLITATVNMQQCSLLCKSFHPEFAAPVIICVRFFNWCGGPFVYAMSYGRMLRGVVLLGIDAVLYHPHMGRKPAFYHPLLADEGKVQLPYF